MVHKASAGAAEHLPVARVPNLVAALKELKDKAIADGSTAFEYEQKVRQMLVSVR